jgi:hypothetical protein
MATINATLNQLTDKKHPGSREALDGGCTCPVEENHYGKGYLGGSPGGDGSLIFAVSEDCPLHRRGRRLRQGR